LVQQKQGVLICWAVPALQYVADDGGLLLVIIMAAEST
jgi:hypothetical protein